MHLYACENWDALENHFKETHSFLCVSCDTTFETKIEIENHQKSAHTVPITQKENSQENASIDNLDDQKKTSHSDPTFNNPIECIPCETTFQTKDELKKHMELEHNQNVQG